MFFLSLFSDFHISTKKTLTLCQQESGWGFGSQWSLKLMEVFLQCGEGDKKFIVFPAREMSADSLSWTPPCKTLPDRTLCITHYLSLLTLTYLYLHSTQCTVELAGIRRKETKRLGVPPDPHKHQIFTQATGPDQTCLLLRGPQACSLISPGTFQSYSLWNTSHTHSIIVNCLISPLLSKQGVACSNHQIFCVSIHFLCPETNDYLSCLPLLICTWMNKLW